MKTVRLFLKWARQFEQPLKGIIYDREHGVWRGVFGNKPNPYDVLVFREVPPNIQVSKLVIGIFSFE